MRKRYINCVFTWKTSPWSLMYHMRLPDNLGLSSLDKLSTPGAGAEKGWGQKQRAYFMGEGKSLIFTASYSKHLLSTLPAGWIWWGQTERHCLSDRSSKKQLTSLPQSQRFGASDMAHPGRGWARARACPSSEEGGPGAIRSSGYGRKRGKKHLFCPV